MRRLNVIGPMVVKLRHAHGWTQNDLIARLQLEGGIISRQTLANIEIGRAPVSDERIAFFAKVFRVRVEALFPEHLRDGCLMPRLENQFAPRRLRRSRYDDDPEASP